MPYATHAEALLAAFAAWLRGLPLGVVVLGLVAQNLAVFGLALAWGALVRHLGRARPIARPPPPITRVEVASVAVTVALNTAVTLVGYLLFKAEVVRFRTDVGVRAWLDAPLLLLIMDAAMYGLHRVVHVPWLFRWAHALHHRFADPRPLTLFVLHPLEVLGFGALWLTVISLVSWSWLGMAIYLTLNVAFGTVGHLGVEPVPPRVARWPVLRWVAGSSFHGQHHQFPEHNFGFYTVIWDRFFGTLRPNYDADLGRVAQRQDAPETAK